MIEAEYRYRLKGLLDSLGVYGDIAQDIIETKSQDCETRSIYREIPIEEAFDADLLRGEQADEH